MVTSSNAVRCYAVAANVSAELHPARCSRAAIIPSLHGRNSCRNFRLTDITRSGDHPFTRAPAERRRGRRRTSQPEYKCASNARGFGESVRAVYAASTSESRRKGNRALPRCTSPPRERCFRLAGEQGDRWWAGVGRGERGAGRGSLIHGDPESIGDACNHLVTAALCGCESRAGTAHSRKTSPPPPPPPPPSSAA